MKAIALATPMLLLLGMSAEAEESHALRGLFCRTEAQIVETFGHMTANRGPGAAVEMTNRDEIACVYADRIDYVVVRPFIIGQVRHNGVSFVEYEATLTGVRVGGNLRPIEPAVRVFFVQPDRLPGAIVLGKA